MRKRVSFLPAVTLACLMACAAPALADATSQRIQGIAGEVAALAAAPDTLLARYFDVVAPLGFGEQAEYAAVLAPVVPERSASAPTAKRLPLAMLIDAAMGNASLQTLEAIEDAQAADGAALYFEQGPVFLDDIRAALVALAGTSETPAARTTLTLSMPLVLSSRAVLVLLPGEELVLDRSAGTFVVAAGGIVLDGATIASSETSNAGEAKFRPFVVADATNGPVQISHGHLNRLGFGQDPRSAGLTITGGNPVPEYRSFVQDTTFSESGTLSLVDAAQSTIRRNIFKRSSTTALAIASSVSVIVDGNAIVEPTQGHGIKLGPNATNVLLSDNIVAASEKHGLLVEGDTRGSLVFNNFLFENGGAGIAVLNSACLPFEQNMILANADDGIMVRNSASLSFQTNFIAANRRAGFSIAGTSGDVSLDENRFEDNKIGMRASASFQLALSNNDWTGQSPRLLDGDIAQYTLPLLDGIKTGNTRLTMAGLPLPASHSAALQTCASEEAI
jgi:poly(beta-D-mannuronate) C5 epimerase